MTPEADTTAAAAAPPEADSVLQALAKIHLFHGIAERGLARIAFFVVPSAAAFLLIGDVLAAGLYRGGAFTVQSGLWVWMALAGSAIGLVAGTMGRLYSSASYAMGDATTPLRYRVR